MKILFNTPLSLPVKKIQSHFDQELFTYLSPHIVPFKLIRFDGCKKGDEIHIEFGMNGIMQKWVSLITYEGTNAKGWSFIDEGKVLPWPLSSWKHHHRVDKVSDTESIIVDDIEYECRPALMAPVISPLLWSMFALRPYRYKQFFKDRV